MADAERAKKSLNERLDFIGMDSKARAELVKLRPLLKKALGPALTTFYAKIRQTPDTSLFFGDERRRAGAQNAQERHWEIISDARYNDDYVNAVLKIGQTHARIGLEPRWYIGGYALVMEQLIHTIVKEHWPRLIHLGKDRPEALAEALSCLVKATMLDMDFAISVYLETLEEQRRRAEDAGVEAIRSERGEVANSIGVGMSKLAAKDLTYRMAGEIPEAYRQLQVDFNAAMEQLETAIQSVSSSTAAIHTGTQEISAASDDLSRRTEQQAASLEETAAALNEITATVKRAAEGAKHARQVVATADQDAKQSASVVRQAIEAMDGISNSAQQISQIIGVIDEIAFQTNLLALNAGVEAARAGDAGRGFAVVASEVRALAQRSAEAAKEIKNLISTSTTQVDQGVKLVIETGKSLERIILQVADINTVVSQIATGASEQANGLQEVNSAISQMDKVTQQNAAMVEESTAASRSLSQEAEQLTGLIHQFQVGATHGAVPVRSASKKAAPIPFRPKSVRPDSGKPVRPPPRPTGKAVVNGSAASPVAENWEEF